jgi:hypothetical protein
LKAYYRRLIGFLVDYREDVHQINEIPIVFCFKNELPAVSKLRDLLPLLFYCISVPVSFSFFDFLGFLVAQLPSGSPTGDVSLGRRETRRTRNCTMGHFWGVTNGTPKGPRRPSVSIA